MSASQKPEGTAVAAPREITTANLPALIASSKTARDTIAPFLPEGVSLERVAASLRIALGKDRAAWAKKRASHRPRQGEAALPEESPLERCSPMSVFLSVAKIAQWGLEVGETAHLVPFGDECTPIAEYKGLAQLVIGSGVVQHVEAHCVYEKEPFTLKYGTTTQLEHRPIGDPKQRGAMVGAYAIFRLRGGMVHIKYSSTEEIDAIRQQYSKQWKGGSLQPWYAEKTVVRSGVKLLPKDPRLAKTLAAFDEIEAAELALAVPQQLQALAAGDVAEVAAPPVEHAAPRPLADDANWLLDDDEPAVVENAPQAGGDLFGAAPTVASRAANVDALREG